MPISAETETVLAAWRAVEREVERTRGIVDTQTRRAELTRLHVEARQLRNEYQRLVRGAVREDLPLSPPSALSVER